MFSISVALDITSDPMDAFSDFHDYKFIIFLFVTLFNIQNMIPALRGDVHKNITI